MGSHGIKDRVANLRVGPGTDERSEMGPLVTGPHRDRVASYLDSGVREGATLAVDGRVHPVIGGTQEGFWLGPSVLDHVTPQMSCYTDEIFGPVLSVLRAPTYEAAVGLVNDSPYGNGVAIFTNDGGAARRFVSEAEIGMVGPEGLVGLAALRHPGATSYGRSVVQISGIALRIPMPALRAAARAVPVRRPFHLSALVVLVPTDPSALPGR